MYSQCNQRRLTLVIFQLDAQNYLFIYLFIYLYVCIYNFFLFGATAPQWAMSFSFTRFLDHTQRRSTVGRTPLDE